MHLISMHKEIEAFSPAVVVIDPISNLVAAATVNEVKAMLSRLVDYLKLKQITAFCTDLTNSPDNVEKTEIGISSLMDAWLLLQNIESGGERNRGLYILKARGIAHSNQVREFLLTDTGVQLRDIYVGPGGVLTGVARMAQEAREAREARERRQELERRQRELRQKQAVMNAQITALKAQFENEREELKQFVAQETLQEENLMKETRALAKARQADVALAHRKGTKGVRKQ